MHNMHRAIAVSRYLICHDKVTRSRNEVAGRQIVSATKPAVQYNAIMYLDASMPKLVVISAINSRNRLADVCFERSSLTRVATMGCERMLSASRSSNLALLSMSIGVMQIVWVRRGPGSGVDTSYNRVWTSGQSIKVR